MLGHKEIKEIHRLLERAVVTPEQLLEWFETKDSNVFPQTFHLLSNYLKNHRPQTLYRYRQAKEEHIEAFKDDKIFLTRADYFNDPYDCMLYFDQFAIETGIAEQLQNDNMKDHLISSGYPALWAEAGLKITIDDVLKRLEKSRSDFLKHVSFILPSVTIMLQKSMSIACFTEDITSPVMWAHYADSHSGFVLAYQFRSDMFSPNPYQVYDVDYDWYGWRSVLPVNYSNCRVDGTALADWYCLCKMSGETGLRDKRNDLSIKLPDSLLKTKLALHKGKEWQYEKEWRMILSSEWPNQAEADHTHILYSPTALFLGCHIGKEEKSQLIKIAKGKGISAYQMYIDYSSKEYKMAYRLIA